MISRSSAVMSTAKFGRGALSLKTKVATPGSIRPRGIAPSALAVQGGSLDPDGLADDFAVAVRSTESVGRRVKPGRVLWHVTMSVDAFYEAPGVGEIRLERMSVSEPGQIADLHSRVRG